jgi:hypothetical protein
MLASHYSEIDTRWPYEYGILNFARRWPRTWSTANEQRKQVRCLQKVTRWHPNHTWRQHEDVNFYSSLYPQNTRRPHDGYTTSYWEYDAFELDHEGVTWPPDGIFRPQTFDLCVVILLSQMNRTILLPTSHSLPHLFIHSLFLFNLHILREQPFNLKGGGGGGVGFFI